MQPSSARCSTCQATDSIKSDKNNSGNREVAWQDPSCLASRATCCYAHRQQGGGPVAACRAEPPAPQHSRAPPDPTVVIFQRPGLVTCEQHGWRGSSGSREGCKQGVQRGARRDPTPGQLAPHAPLYGSAPTRHRQDGLSCQPASAPHGSGGDSGEEELPAAQDCEPWASAGSASPACSSCLRRESVLGAGGVACQRWGRFTAPPSPANSKAVKEIKSPVQGPRSLSGAGALPRQHLCIRLTPKPSPPGTGSLPGEGSALCCAG